MQKPQSNLQGRTKIRDPEAVGIRIAQHWGYMKFLSYDEIKEEISSVCSALDLLEIEPYWQLFASLLKSHLYRATKAKGFHKTGKPRNWKRVVALGGG